MGRVLPIRKLPPPSASPTLQEIQEKEKSCGTFVQTPPKIIHSQAGANHFIVSHQPRACFVLNRL